jgi:ribosomal-protein-alanine N-acetyltransferase
VGPGDAGPNSADRTDSDSLGAGYDWIVRAMLREDVPGVLALAAQEPTAPHWPPHEYDRMLDVIASSPARRGAWVLLSPGGNSGDVPQAVAGFCMATQVARICDLEVVVVGAASRGRRLGERLVCSAVAWGRGLGASRMELEVRAGNAAAIQLYERMGFRADGRRPGYYHQPEEDAILMSLRI